MKRQTYVDEEGNPINQSLQRKKPLLTFFFFFGTILPIIIIIIIIVLVTLNLDCQKVYKAIKEKSLSYIKDQGTVPAIEGENVTVRLDDLYTNGYLSSTETKNNKCSGTVKITKYKKDYIYTIDARNCSSCSTNRKYSVWSKESTVYPSGKAIVDVVPYYNYYDREVSTTKWSDYYDNDELSDETSKYGIKLPLDTSKLPEIPKEAKLVNIENDTTYYYRYRDRSWKWYDIEGDYSDFFSEQPQGYANKDEDSSRYTKWTKYSLDYPEEKSYRTITSTTGYKFYYLNNKGKKIYFNSGKYSARDDVNTKKYNRIESETAKLYRYRDKQWRWYNGTKRRYSALRTTPQQKLVIKDKETETLSEPTNWIANSKSDATNQEFRVEERKLMTRFRQKYEILSLKVLKEPINKEAFEKKVRMSIPSFAYNENYKMEVTYKFKYRKS